MWPLLGLVLSWMTKTITSTVIVLAVLAASHRASAQALLWSQVSGSTGYDRSLAVAVDADRNVYQAGIAARAFDGQSTPSPGDGVMYLIKYDASGAKLWTRFYGTNLVYPAAMAVDAKKNVYVAGSFYDQLFGQTKRAGPNDLFLLKLDPDGNKIWLRIASSAGSESAAGVAIGGSGNIYVAGYAEAALEGQPSIGSYDFVLLKYAPDGERMWVRTHGTTKMDVANSMALDAQENLYLAGSTIGPVSLPNYDLEDMYVAKYDKNGSKQWERLFGTKRLDTANDVAVDRRGNVYVGGIAGARLDDPTGAALPSQYLIKLDSKGSTIWTRVLPVLGRLATDNADNLYVAGVSVSRGKGRDFDLAQYDSDGKWRWSRAWGTSTDDALTAMAVDPEGLVYLAGETSGRPSAQKDAGETDLYVAKYNPRPPSFDCSKATSVQELLICKSPSLSSLDSEIDRLYRASLDNDEAKTRSSQLRWLRSKRSACGTPEELEVAMKKRVSALNDMLHASSSDEP
jgi:hypothetical protein